jgi:N-acyl-D-aspartate/D-glutamate deacylase
MQVKTNRASAWLALFSSKLFNTVLRANYRWQTLAEPFVIFGDGAITPLFEEFSAGQTLLAIDEAERTKLLGDTQFRKQFRKDWLSRKERLFHRNLSDMWVEKAPDSQLEGHSFSELAEAKNLDPVDYFLDCLRTYGSRLRWKTIVGNENDRVRFRIFSSRETLPGFNDSGAHYRNMAYQDGGLHYLRQAMDHGLPALETAVHKLTGLSAEWLGLQTGTLTVQSIADVIVLDPNALQKNLGDPIALEDSNTGYRLVKRSPGVIQHVLIGGQMAFSQGDFVPEFGKQKFGRLLRVNA